VGPSTSTAIRCSAEEEEEEGKEGGEETDAEGGGEVEGVEWEVVGGWGWVMTMSMK